MIVAVLDTNTIVSAILEPRGIPNQILEAVRSQQSTLAISSVVIAEVLTTLSRDRIRRKYHINSADIARLRDLLEHETPCTLISHEDGKRDHRLHEDFRSICLDRADSGS